MAAGFTPTNRVSADYVGVTTMSCDTAYPTGGYPVTPSQFGFGVSIDDMIPIAQSASYVAEWVAATQSIRVLQDTGSGLVEVPNNTDLHTLNVQLLVFGR
jgi:hypothetical protein